MQTLTRDVDAAANARNSDAYSLALATQARQKLYTPLLGSINTLKPYINLLKSY